MKKLILLVHALFCFGCASASGDKSAEIAPAEQTAPAESSFTAPEYADTGDGEKLGSLPKETIQLVVRQNRDAIRGCYQRQLRRDPTLGGKVVVRFKIVHDGTVSRAEIAESTMNDVNVESCIRQEVQTWMFAEPEGGGHVIVNYPFNLHS